MKLVENTQKLVKMLSSVLWIIKRGK